MRPLRECRATSVRLVRSLANRGLERYYNLESADKVGLAELGYDPAERVGYEASRWLALPLGLSGWKPNGDDVFADIGSGKGRVVVQAARHYPFRRVIGVELSAELTTKARRNLERNRGRLRCPRVELVTCDALAWQIPDDLTIAYLFHPFPGEVFSGLVRRLVDFVDLQGRPLRLVYVNPVEHDRLMECDRVAELPPPSPHLARIGGLGEGALRRYELIPKHAD